MRVSVAWLRELLPGLRAPAAELARRLTGAGLEVEGVREVGAGLEPCVIAAVRAVEPHPARASLRLVTVDRGGGVLQRVVCGAPNVPEPGGLVVLAPVGTHLPAVGLTLTPREIGGVLSEGMLCSEVELGLGAESGGILVLPAGAAAPGTPLVQALPAQDTVFELNVTPNRPDALGHVGVARELAALYGLPFAPPAAPEVAEAGPALGALLAVECDDPERCPYYGAAAVVGVRVAPSPLPVRWRLHALGVRPISNVVDLTNWVLLEFGQPLHAFDLDRLRGGRLRVRRAREGEPFTTLDGVPRTLVADDLVIADGDVPSALAGIMGGADSEIRDQTVNVALECAWFAPRGVRRSARRHGLHTESSHRFERGVDHGATPAVLRLARARLQAWAGGQVAAGLLEARGPLPELPRLTLRAARMNQLLGVTIPLDRARAILVAHGLPAEEREPGVLSVLGATHRPDIGREVDLIEEVARVAGMEAIPTVLPAIPAQEPSPAGRFERQVVQHAAALGLSEALLYSFVSPAELRALGAPPAVVTLENPLSEERSVLRTSLLPGLLEALRRARRHGERAVRLFGVGARFLPPAPGERPGAVAHARPRTVGEQRLLPEERLSFAAVLAGPRPAWLAAPTEVDVWDAKGLAVALIERLAGRTPEVRALGAEARPPHLHPRGAGEVLLGGARVGQLGPLHPDVVDALDLGGPALLVELDLDTLEALGRDVARHHPLPRLPAVTRDLAVTVREETPAGEVLAVVRESAGELCEQVELFDVFRGGAIPEAHRSLAFHVVYRDPRAASQPEAARTLTDDEVDQRHAAVVAAVRERVGAALRA